jgi:hypothetical protein
MLPSLWGRRKDRAFRLWAIGVIRPKPQPEDAAVCIRTMVMSETVLRVTANGLIQWHSAAIDPNRFRATGSNAPWHLCELFVPDEWELVRQ